MNYDYARRFSSRRFWHYRMKKNWNGNGTKLGKRHAEKQKNGRWQNSVKRNNGSAKKGSA